MKAPGFVAAMAAASAYEEVAVNCGPNVQCSYTVSYDAAAQPGRSSAASDVQQPGSEQPAAGSPAAL